MNEPYFRPFGPPSAFSSAEEAQAAATEAADTRAAASREASARDMAYVAALGGHTVTRFALPPVKAPVLPPEFAQRVAALDEAISERGISVDADKLLALGKERFERLLELDRKARSNTAAIGTRIDLTDFPSVQMALHAFEASAVPGRSTIEQLNGSGKDREHARKITGFADLWKNTNERQETIRDVYAFHDAFVSLVFGQSMLERLSSDGKLRSRVFTGGKGRKLELFCEWLPVVAGSLTSVKLTQPLWHMVAWLADEQTQQPPSPVELARDFFNVRSPSPAQARLAEAVLDGFLLGYTDWPLWEYVGGQTRSMPDQVRLAAWRKALAARYPRITGFQHEMRVAFYRDVGYGHESHREFDASGHRSFIDRTVHLLLRQVSAVLALALETAFPNSVIARFEGQVLCHGKPKQRAEIAAQLASVFPGSMFQVEFTEVNS
jgi:hypothetical protein